MNNYHMLSNLDINTVPELEVLTSLTKTDHLNSVEGVQCVIEIIFHMSPDEAD